MGNLCKVKKAELSEMKEKQYNRYKFNPCGKQTRGALHDIEYIKGNPPPQSYLQPPELAFLPQLLIPASGE